LKYSEASFGRVFVLRLEDGEVLNDTLETFAREQGLSRALAYYVGGAASGSRVVVGPDANREDDVVPLIHALMGTQEALAVGTLFPNEAGEPVLHMHIASGREEATVTGCVRTGVKIWHIGEVIMFELTDTPAIRKVDPRLGFKLLSPEGE
jgi:predicted DNA-binding protein with PD1-like motif